MIYKNGFMELVCLKGENEGIAYFLWFGNLELVKAFDVVWSAKKDGSIYWNCGDYRGHIMQNLKDDSV